MTLYHIEQYLKNYNEIIQAKEYIEVLLGMYIVNESVENKFLDLKYKYKWLTEKPDIVCIGGNYVKVSPGAVYRSDEIEEFIRNTEIKIAMLRTPPVNDTTLNARCGDGVIFNPNLTVNGIDCNLVIAQYVDMMEIHDELKSIELPIKNDSTFERVVKLSIKLSNRAVALRSIKDLRSVSKNHIDISVGHEYVPLIYPILNKYKMAIGNYNAMNLKVVKISNEFDLKGKVERDDGLSLYYRILTLVNALTTVYRSRRSFNDEYINAIDVELREDFLDAYIELRTIMESGNKNMSSRVIDLLDRYVILLAFEVKKRYPDKVSDFIHIADIIIKTTVKEIK